MKKLIVTGLFLSALPAFAVEKGSVFLEPYLTFENGETLTNYPDPFGYSNGDVVGLGTGLRIGYSFFETLFFGADGRYSIPKFKDSSLNINTNSTTFSYGPVLGLLTPLGLRFWGTYIMNSEINPSEDQDMDAKFSEGSGYRLGTGLKWGVVSLNLEYQYIRYDKTIMEEIGILSPSSNLSDVELRNRSWIFSVSFPLNL
jgi:hypothetical protein